MDNQSSTVFKGKIVQVSTRTIKLPNDYQLDLEVVEHPGGSAIVALNAQREICLLKQYRAVFDEWFWELPAGKRDNEEPPLETARRELLEEAGVEASRWRDLGSMASSPGVFTERVYLYLATELSFGKPETGEDELISERQWITLEQACQWAYEGKINDAKSVIAILRAAHKLR